MSDIENTRRYTISAGTVIKVLVILVLFIVLAQIVDILLAILTSIVLASAVQPFSGWFMRKLRFPRVLAVITVYLAVFIVVGGLLFLFIPLIADEAVQLSANLPEQVTKLASFGEGLHGSLAGEKISKYIAEQLSGGDVLGSFGQTLKGVGGGAVATAGRLFGGLFTTILVIVLSFYFAVQERGVENFLRLVVPGKHEDYAVSLWQRTERKIGLWIQGQLLLAVIIGIFVFLGLTIFGVKYALLLALLAAVMELIPIFGPILAAVPAIALAFTHSTTIGLAMIAFYVIIQQFENHLIYPLVVRKIVGVPPLLVIIALLIGWQLVGFMGILLAVPVAAFLMELVDDAEKRKHTV